MIKLELRNTKTQKTVFVDTRGAVFGREGGDADVKLQDQGVSKKHARIYTRRGEWFLEDLNSANGTYVDSNRIAQPVKLEPGAMFQLSRQQFEVVQFVEDEPEPTQAPREDMQASSDEQEQYDGGGDEEEPPQDEEFEEPPPPEPPRREPRGASARRNQVEEAPRKAGPARSAARSANVEADEAPEGFDVGYFMKAIPKAIAYYLAAIPLMLVNPIGFVRKSTEEQQVPAMGKMQLIAYAFPAMLANAAFAFLAGLFAQIAAGAISIGAILPIVPLIVAVVGSVVTGFIWHPVTEWIVNKLGGQTDARSRSNWFANTMTVYALSAVPAMIGAVLLLIPLGILQLIPVLLSAVVTLISLYVLYAWVKHSGVVQWFQYGVLGLGALAMLGVVFSSLAVITSAISGGGSAMMASSSASGDADSGDLGEVPPEWQQALEAAKASGSPEAVASVEQQIRVAMAAKKQAEAAQAAAEKTQQEAQAAAQPKPEEKAPESQPEVKVETASANTEATTRTAKLEMPPPPAATKPVRGMSYPEYKKKLTAIESAISEDPTLLQRVDGLLPLYSQFHKARYEAEDRARGQQKKSERWQSEVNARLREAEVYKDTQELVGKLHARMFP